MALVNAGKTCHGTQIPWEALPLKQHMEWKQFRIRRCETVAIISNRRDLPLSIIFTNHSNIEYRKNYASHASFPIIHRFQAVYALFRNGMVPPENDFQAKLTVAELTNQPRILILLAPNGGEEQ